MLKIHMKLNIKPLEMEAKININLVISWSVQI